MRAEAMGAVETHRRRAGYPEKGRVVLCKGARLKYHFINEHRSIWDVIMHSGQCSQHSGDNWLSFLPDKQPK